jgi:hypothetical protein
LQHAARRASIIRACLDHPQHDPGKFDRSIRDARRLKNLSARL